MVIVNILLYLDSCIIPGGRISISQATEFINFCQSVFKRDTSKCDTWFNKTQDRLCKKICCKHTQSAWLHFSSLKAPFRQSPAFRQLYLPASFYPRCSIWWKDLKAVYRSKSLHSRCCENSDWKSDNICIPHVPCLLCGGYLHSIEAIKSLSHPEADVQYNCRRHGLIWPTDVVVQLYAGTYQ